MGIRRPRGRQEDSSGGLKDVAWHEDNTFDSPHAVATKMANAWGLYDMQGNAWEWCLDVWQPDYRGAALDGGARMSDPTIHIIDKLCFNSFFVSMCYTNLRCFLCWLPMNSNFSPFFPISDKSN